ncbi:zinc ribbon domain-containing protein [Salibacterium lacus]|uniref:Zinc ribbon domain-containing protein n=1 Tax=Salibacterium lacus TaxID=1898109 RepID=A0ABW5T6K3_9BACI
MKCQSCGSEWEEGAVFCVYCGTREGEEQEKEVSQEQSAATVAGAVGKETAASFGKGYLDFVKHGLQTPVKMAAGLTEKEWVYGLVSLLLFIIFLPLTFFVHLSSIPMGMIQISFGSGFMQPAFILLLLFAVMLAVIFGALKLMHSGTSFQQIIAVYGSLVTAGAVLTAASLLLALIHVVSLSFLFLFVSLSVTATALVTTYYLLNKTQSGLDSFYASLGTFCVMGAVTYFIAESIVRNILNQMNGMNMFF